MCGWLMGGGGTGFLEEIVKKLRVVRQISRKTLIADLTVQRGVKGTKDRAHAAMRDLLD